MNTDLTTGNTSRLLWAFSIPMLISVAFQQFYNIADSVIAGRFIGEQALAAVGASYPITMIFMARCHRQQHRLYRRCIPAFRQQALRHAENSRWHHLLCRCCGEFSALPLWHPAG